MSTTWLALSRPTEQMCLLCAVALFVATNRFGRSSGLLSPSPEVPYFIQIARSRSGRCFPLRGECRSLAIGLRRYLSNLRR
jgi:hypothetical protein